MMRILEQNKVPSIIPFGNVKLAAIGEGPGVDEDLWQEPFVGVSGQELKSMLADAELDWKEMFLGNIVSCQPPSNKLENLCVGRLQLPDKGVGGVQLYRGRFLHPYFQHEIERLRQELLAAKPNLILALGAAPMAVLTGNIGIIKSRGAITESTLIPGAKVLGTFHPAAVLRNWKWRVIAVADFIKAKREQEFPAIIRPKRKIWIDPTIADLELFGKKHLDGARQTAIDIETAWGQITCISFAPSATKAIVVPFVSKASPNYSYWPTVGEEMKAWSWVKRYCENDSIKVLQNGVYDFQWLWKLGIRIKNYYEDTLLLHHSLYPELPKALSFLGSIYTNEASWKLYSPRGYRSTKLEDVA